EVDRAGRNRAARHAVELRFFGVLRDRETTALLDVAQAQRSIRAGAGQYDTDCGTVMGGGESPQEMVDGCTLEATCFQLRQPQVCINRIQVRVWRYDVYPIAFQWDGGCHLLDGHGRVLLQQLRQVTFVLGRQVHDDDTG